jgi:hypothetical protein
MIRRYKTDGVCGAGEDHQHARRAEQEDYRSMYDVHVRLHFGVDYAGPMLEQCSAFHEVPGR